MTYIYILAKVRGGAPPPPVLHFILFKFIIMQTHSVFLEKPIVLKTDRQINCHIYKVYSIKVYR